MTEHQTSPASAAPAGTPQAPDGDLFPDDAPVTAQDAAPDDDDGTDAPGPIAPEFELVTITYRGRSWNVPKDRGQWDMNVQFEFEEGRRLIGLLTLLGGSPDHVPVAKAQVYSVCRTNNEVNDFMDHCTEVLNKECTG